MSATGTNPDNTNENVENTINNRKHDSVKKCFSGKIKKNDCSVNDSTVIKVKSAIPRRRQELLKWYGWGYKDSKFLIHGETASFTGERYAIGGKDLPLLALWANENFGIEAAIPPKIPEPPKSYEPCRLSDDVIKELEGVAIVSVDGMDRLIRSHGQTLKDMADLRTNSLKRIPDAVIWPECHEQVEKIVECASRNNFVIIPFGGGTSVSGAVTCPANEPRAIVVLDTTNMNSILWLDKEQLLARIQAGIVGQDLEREMRARGFTVGHEPDSYEFSTLGGWVATRASGMKKNTYGNIEDLVVQTKVVTPRGVFEKSCRVPRISCGPEWEHVIMGSEGCFGVVTEVTIKIRPLPPVTRYGSLIFPDWESGFYFEREVARQRLQPSSIRLMDNEQFRFGQALKMHPSWGGAIIDGLKKFYITRVKGFDPHKLCVVTLLLEGTADDVAEREKRLNAIAAKYGGLSAGAANGENGYTLTFVIAYLRDIAMDYDVVAESFETSVPWDRTLSLCRNVKRRLRDECEARGLTHYFISCRLTQTYDAGCCIYFYFAHNTANCTDPVATYEEIETAARDEIIACGGSISHHHGVGKLRKKWYLDTVSEPGHRLLLAAKKALDPDNIFALGNIAFDEGQPIQTNIVGSDVKSKL